MPQMTWASLRSTLILSLLVVVPGCSRDDAPNAPAPAIAVTPQVAEDLALHMAATLATGGVPVDRVAGQGFYETVRSTGRSGPSGANQVQDGAGFSWSLAVTYYDANDEEQAWYSHGVTARARIEARARGSITTALHQASIGTARLLDVRGLLPNSAVLVVDGAANDTASCAFESRDGVHSRTYDLLSVGTLEAMRSMKDRNANPYPLSGVLTWNVVADAVEQDEQGERTSHYEARVVVTFNGTRHPTIEVDKKWRYGMDLETGALTALPS